MELRKIVSDFTMEGQADRAVFDKAMCQYIEEHGFTMSDLLFQVYSLQKRVDELGEFFTSLRIDQVEELEGLHDRLDEAEEYFRGFNHKVKLPIKDADKPAKKSKI